MSLIHFSCITATWVAILAPKMVQSLTLVSPSPLECRSEISSAMVGEWLPMACSNKGKNGDRTGTIPRERLEVISSYFFGDVGDRDVDRKEAFLDNFQRRYGTGRGPEELTTQAHYFQRKMIPAKQRALVKCPVLILQGGADKMTSPVEEAGKWQDGFVNAKGGADLRTLVDAPHLLAFFSPNVTSRFIQMFVLRCEYHFPGREAVYVNEWLTACARPQQLSPLEPLPSHVILYPVPRPGPCRLSVPSVPALRALL